jgi:hypothetical protein
MKKTTIKITTTECAGIAATAWIDEHELEQAKAAFIEWNEPNSYFRADRFDKRLFRWEYVETVCVMERGWDGNLEL